MKITLKTIEVSDKILIIRSENSVTEDGLIDDWHNQIIEHLKKLRLEEKK